MIDKINSTKEIQIANSRRFLDILFSSPLIKEASKAPTIGTIIIDDNKGKEVTIIL